MKKIFKGKRFLSLLLLLSMLVGMTGEVMAEGGFFWQEKKINRILPTLGYKTNEEKIHIKGTTEGSSDIKVFQWIDGGFQEVGTIAVKDKEFDDSLKINTSNEGYINFKLEQEIAGKKETDTFSIMYKKSAPEIRDLILSQSDEQGFVLRGNINTEVTLTVMM